MQYRREIDGLRAIAVIPVILFHAGFGFASGGYLGVDVFFVISGFLITTIIINDLEKDRFSIVNFYERRARRIIPALTFVIISTTVVALFWMLPADLMDVGKAIIAATLFLSNVYFWKEVGYFEFGSEENPLLHTWSLAVEEQYYLFFPVMMAIFWFMGKRNLAALILFLAVLSLALSQWALTAHPWANFYLLPTRAWELFVGSLAAFYLSRTGAIPSLTPKPIFGFLSFVGLSCVIASMIFFDETSPAPGVISLIPTLGTALILLFTQVDSLTWRILSNKAFVAIGLISYSAYLWHQPLFALARSRSVSSVMPAAYYPPLIAVALVLAYLSWRYVEQPFRDKDKVSRKGIFAFSGCAMVAMILIGVVVIRFDGFPARIPEEVKALEDHIVGITNERETYISSDGCYSWSGRDMPAFDRFLADWSCHGDESAIKEYPAMITGDSMSASIVMAMKLNGRRLANISSGGCSLVPKSMTPQCKKQFDLAIKFVRENEDYKQMWLVNRFADDELDLDSIASMVDYFGKSNAQLVFFSAPPQFDAMDRLMVKNRWYKPEEAGSFRVEASTYWTEKSERQELLDYLDSRQVKHVNVRKIFCSLTPECTYRTADGVYLTVDKDHLSVEGAKVFGVKLMETIDRAYQEWRE